MKVWFLSLSTIFSMGLFIVFISWLIHDKSNFWLGIFMTGISGIILIVLFIFELNKAIEEINYKE
jgi:Na+/melibiose symporter-like transporter